MTTSATVELAKLSDFSEIDDLDDATWAYLREEWTALHRHNAALRKVGKAILKDLWIAGSTEE